MTTRVEWKPGQSVDEFRAVLIAATARADPLELVLGQTLVDKAAQLPSAILESLLDDLKRLPCSTVTLEDGVTAKPPAASTRRIEAVPMHISPHVHCAWIK